MVTQTQTQKKWLDAKDVAKDLNVHPKTVYAWMDKGANGRILESWKAGGKRVTTPEAIERFMVPHKPLDTAKAIADRKRLEDAKRVLAEFGL